MHRTSLHEAAEQTSTEMAQRSQKQQIDLQDALARVQELEAEASALRHEVAQDSAFVKTKKTSAAERHDETAKTVEALAKNNLRAGLHEQSLTVSEHPAATQEMEKLMMDGKVAEQRANLATSQVKELQKEITGLNLNLETARRELRRARRERDGLQEDVELLRVAAAEHESVISALRSESRVTEQTLAEADSISSAHRAELAKMSTELLDKDAELRKTCNEKIKLESELKDYEKDKHNSSKNNIKPKYNHIRVTNYDISVH